MAHIYEILMIILAATAGLATIRLARGPTLPDRVVALDVLAMLVVGLTALAAIAFNMRVLLDITIALALVTFVGTVAFAYYLEKRVR